MRTPLSSPLAQADAPIALLRRNIARAGRTGWHKHTRGEILYATEGLMVITTEQSVWMVPTGFALIVAAEVRHDSACEGPLSLCAAFIDPSYFSNATRGAACHLIRVSALLDAALTALADDQDHGAYDPHGRAGLLARIVASELERAESAEFGLPIPVDRRLRRICTRLMEEPSLPGDIDYWAATIGLSRRTMTRKFREQTSLSFGEWRRRLRTASATMQSAGGVPFQRVANLVGYKTVHGLRAMMKRAATMEALAETRPHQAEARP